MNLSTKIGGLILLIGTVFVLASGWFFYGQINNELRADIIERDQIATQLVLNSIDRLLESRLDDISGIAEAPYLENPASPLELILDRLVETGAFTGPWDYITYLDLEGNVIASTNKEKIGSKVARDSSEGLIYDRALREKTAVHSDAVPSVQFDRPTMMFAAPVQLEEAGRPTIGILVAALAWPALEELLNEVPSPDAHLMNRDDLMIAALGVYNNYPYFTASKSFPIYKDIVQAEELGSGNYAGNAWTLHSPIYDSEFSAQANRVAMLLVLELSGITVLFYILMLLVLRLVILSPIRKLKSGVVALAKGEFEHKTDIRSRDELGDLATAFNSMAGSIQSLNTRLKSKVALQQGELVESYSKLEFEKRKLEVALLSIGDAAFMIDTKERLTFFNPIAEQITGFASAEVLGKPYKEYLKFLYEKDHTVNSDFIKRALVDGMLSHITNHTMLITKDKREVPVADSAAPILDESGEIVGCIVVFRDVTKEREIDRTKTEFISLAAHQLRTPLTAIRWSLEALADEKAIKPAQRETLDITMAASEKMAHIITALLNIARIDSQRLKIEPKIIDVKEACGEALAILEPLIKKKGHQVKLTVDKGVGTIETDPMLLHEILMNLLSNAIKYTADHGKISLEVELRGTDLSFSVRDNGYGIPANQQDHIFQKFFRAENIIKRDTEGSGLGLYMVQQLVQTLGGKISFSSKENVGTTIQFFLPAKGLKPQKGEVSLA